MFLSVIALLLAVAMTMLFYNDPGYVMIAFHNLTIELPLWLLVAICFTLIISVLLFIKIIRAICCIIKFPKRWQKKQAKENTQAALLELASGHWKKAEKRARNGAKYSSAPIINYLVASYAAAALGSHNRANKYLNLAKKYNHSNKYSGAIEIAHKWLENSKSSPSRLLQG